LTIVTGSSRWYLAVRKIHNIRVLTREKGSWLIASHQIMDEKERLP